MSRRMRLLQGAVYGTLDRYSSGDIIRTVQVEDPSQDWAPEAREHCQWGAGGVVVGVSDSHGLCYEVIHQSIRRDGTMVRAYYEHRELEFVQRML